MKQYLLLFKSGDFVKTSNALTGNPLWTSNAVNLYSNSQYKNYSYTRSRYGLNLIGDNTYVGTEVTSPSYSQESSTPLSSNVVYVTNVGEVVYEPATPDLLRFLDTSSRIDILAYKHTFTNTQGLETPSFNIQIHESDVEDGPWLKSSLSFDSNIIFIRNSKPWIKIELEIFSENLDVSDLGLLFYLEIGIHEPTSPVVSTVARNILRRFPTWTKLFDDSLEPATPSLAIPESTGGKFLTALVQENIDDIVSQMDLRDINAFINSADENMLAWAFVSYDIPTNIQTVVGDDVNVVPVNSLADFHRSKITDHVYYYNAIDKQILTMRDYTSLLVNGSPYEQYAVNIFNDFDEFGAKVGLQRLYKETNSRYKKRILDVSQNVPAIYADGLKRTLRRELDIWNAYGLDVNSASTQSFPGIYEISDLEKTTPYFSPSGKPEKIFKDLVEDLNSRYPSNIGYVRWGEGTWDYSGLDGEGISRIPAIYDVGTSPLSEYYQPGIGDFSDGRFILESLEKSTISFNGSMSIAGVHKTGIEYAYTPILVDYSWYVSYLRTVQDYNAGRRKFFTITGASYSTTYATTTYVTSAPHGLSNGDTVAITGTIPSSYNTTRTILGTIGTNQFYFVGNQNPKSALDTNGSTTFTVAGVTVTAGSFVTGKVYTISAVGTTSFTAIGAASNTIGVVFTATGPGTGTGTASFTGTNVTTAGTFTSGQLYTIVTPGTTDFVTLYGAANNNIGTTFTATSNPGTGTGTAGWSGTVTGVTGTVTGGSSGTTGSGAVFTIQKTGSLNGFITANTVVTVTNGGSNYQVGNIITIPGAQLGGTTPTNNLALRVASKSDGLHVSGTGKVENVNKADVGVGLTYEIIMPPHDNYATPSTFYSNLNYSNRDDFYVGNRFPATSSASPEFNYIRIFDQEGNTVPDVVFKDKIYNQIYLNTHASPITNSITFNDASSVKIVFSNGGWNYVSQRYDTSLATASYRASFSTGTPSYYVNPSANSQISMATPNRRPQDANIKIGSTDYSTKIESFNTSPLQSNFSLNPQNDPSILGTSTKSIYVNDMLNRVILPASATPQFLYVNVEAPNGLGYFGQQSIQQGVVGGRTINPDDNSQYLIPSSPNISWQPFSSSNVSLGSSNYFNSATINYAATPHYLLIESATSSYYPIYFDAYEAFTAQTTPNLFSGYIDSLDNVYQSSENEFNSYFNTDSFLSKIYLDKSSFGLIENDVYIIKDAALNTGQDEVEAYVESRNRLLSDLNSSFSQENEMSVDIYAKKDKFLMQEQRSALHTGWIYLDENDYYIYANPVTESSTGRFFNIKLSNTPRNGAPVLVNVNGQSYRNIAFEDAATPGKLTFQNSETVKASADQIIYLAYEDILNVSITDNYTGKQMAGSILVESNRVRMGTGATPLVYDREYLVSYKANNAWYLDNDVYNSANDNYNSILYFSATPNTNSVYNITYENSVNDNTYPIDLSLSSSVNPIDEGYIYVSNQDYPFSHVEAYLSPAYISDSISDLMYLSLVSYDNQNNLKPGQTFAISGDVISATPSYLTTSDNGLATSVIRYNGSIPAVYNESIINIVGVGSSTPNGGPNSSSQGYALSVPFNVNRNDPFNLSVKAAASDLNINADGISKLSISGKVYWKNKPFNNQIQLSWNTGRTLKNLFAATPDYVVNTDSNGEFTISNAITANDSSTPGYWFARINVSNPKAVTSILTSSGEVLSSNDVTISGDVIYWHESYDSIQYSYENDIPLPNIYTISRQEGSQIVATPRFAYSHADAEIIYSYNSTPNWSPPKWVPLNRYDQYQMGLMGSTPYYISDYSLLHPDHEEE